MLRSLLISVVTVAALPTVAVAQTDEVPTRNVSYADLDMSSPAGRATFHNRMERAIRDVCPSSDGRDLARRRLTLRCMTEARARTQEQVARIEQHYGTAVASIAR